MVKLLQDTDADCLIANAGSVPLELLCKEVPRLKNITWVVEKTSRHMDWTGAPESAAGKTSVSVWHDIIQEEKGKTNSELPTSDGVVPGNVIVTWLTGPDGSAEIVEFSQQVSKKAGHSTGRRY